MGIRSYVTILGEKMTHVLPWAMPLKLILGALLGALGSAGLLGYLSEFATYSYSIHYGFRPPVEGIPYLRAAVAYGSFFLLVSGALIFGFSIAAIKSFIEYLDNISRRARKTIGLVVERPDIIPLSHDMTEMFSKRTTKQIVLILLVVTGISAASGYVFAIVMQMIDAKEKVSPATGAICFGSYGFITTLAISRKGAIWWMAGVATIAYFALWLILLFSPTRYSQFLRMVGHGGGMPVTVEFRDPENSASFSKQSYYLMIRSTDALILYSDSERRFIEIPRDQVRNISHDIGGLQDLPYKLPE